jgi:uncharacterized membrane protein
MTPPRSLTLLSLALASCLCVALVGFRIAHTGSSFYGFLVWNLFLAWVPLVLALLLYDRYRRHASRVALGVLGFLWLIFFPNAPYIVTDFVHLHTRQGVPLWYDVITLSAFAWTGLLLGFASLYLIQAVARSLLGPVRAWLVAGVALALSSFGVYLGRFHRLNSWDLLLQPGRLLARAGTALGEPFAYQRSIAITLALTVFFAAMYLALYGFAHMRVELERRR